MFLIEFCTCDGVITYLLRDNRSKIVFASSDVSKVADFIKDNCK